MAPASKSKAKDKSSRTAKEPQKILSKPSANGGNVQANAYNPFSGTFHTVETVSATSPTPQILGKFRTIDESEEHSIGTTTDYDSKSNNDSCSGESEDQKDKITPGTPRPEPIPGFDTEKRDKIRQKNERKHQRQREKRAQELRERCTGFIMSRKLEVLTQQLVAMGFPAERATMALMLNDGRVEDSVSWLFEGGTESEDTSTLNGICNLKIDISDELASITSLAKKFKCSTQEVEKAIVTCEGDLEKVSETLKSQKQEATNVPTKLDESRLIPANHDSSRLPSPPEKPVSTGQSKPAVSVGLQQTRRDERDSNYPKVSTAIPASDTRTRSLPSSKNTQSRTDKPILQVATHVDKRRPSPSASPALPFTLASPLQATTSPATAEARYGSGEVKSNIQAGYVNMMQRPQFINTQQNSSAVGVGLNMFPQVNAGWNPDRQSGMNIFNTGNDNIRQNILSMNQNTGSPSGSEFFYPANHPANHHSFVPASMESNVAGWGGSLWYGAGTPNSTCSVTATSSLGLFTGWGSAGSSGSSSPVDWSMGDSMLHCDYTSIDWSMDVNTLPSMKTDPGYETTFMGGSTKRAPRLDARVGGFQDGGLGTNPATSAGSCEWTSPFAWKDIFRQPRSFVSSPSL